MRTRALYLTLALLSLGAGLHAQDDQKPVVAFLDFMSACRVDDQFPATINPVEILTLQEKGLFREFPDADPAEAEAAAQGFARSSQGAVRFVSAMRPENDWHYVGKGVVRDSGDTPIAWWRPEGSGAYRVIWADLEVTDEANWAGGI